MANALIFYENEDERPDPPDTKLKRGMIVELGGVKWRVGLVNECRARLDPISKVKREIKIKGGEETKEILVYPTSISISPNSEIKIIKYEKGKSRKKKHTND